MLFGTWDGKFGDSTFMLVQAVMGVGEGKFPYGFLWFKLYQLNIQKKLFA